MYPGQSAATIGLPATGVALAIASSHMGPDLRPISIGVASALVALGIVMAILRARWRRHSV